MKNIILILFTFISLSAFSQPYKSISYPVNFKSDVKVDSVLWAPYRVGIGTSAPVEQLTVNGVSAFYRNIYVQGTLGSTAEALRIHDDNTNCYIDFYGGNLVFRNEATTTAFAIADANLVSLSSGVAINEFSNDPTLAGNSDLAVPTEKAVKTYVDSLTGGGLYLATLELDSSEVKSLFSTPIKVIDAAGVGTIIFIHRAMAKYNYNSTSYVKNIYLKYNTATNYTWAMPSTFSNSDAVNYFNAGATSDVYENADLQVSASTGDELSFDGSIKIYVYYTITTL